MLEKDNIRRNELEKSNNYESNVKKMELLEENNKDLIKVNNAKFENLIDEDTTKYGEFVSSYFAWVGLRRQKDRAEELNEMTRKE